MLAIAVCFLGTLLGGLVTESGGCSGCFFNDGATVASDKLGLEGCDSVAKWVEVGDCRSVLLFMTGTRLGIGIAGVSVAGVSTFVAPNSANLETNAIDTSAWLAAD